jgi:hypothetical protein
MNFSKRFLTQIQPKVAVSFLWQREDLQKWVKGSSVPHRVGTDEKKTSTFNFIAIKESLMNFSKQIFNSNPAQSGGIFSVAKRRSSEMG